MVKARIEARFANRQLSDDISLFATKSPNLAKAVVDAVAVPYSRGCQRELKGASEQVAKAFAEVVAESGIVKKGNGLAARAWFLGPTIVSPHIDTRDKLAVDVLTPDTFDLKMDGPYVEAVLWLAGGTWIELDATAWRYWSMEGDLEKTVAHSTGVCPAVPFIGIDNSNDFWCSSEHTGLVDASLDCAYKMAFGLYSRQVSSNKLVVVQGELKDMPAGQSLGHPALPIYTRAHPSEADVKMIDRSVPAGDHLAEIAAIIALAVSVYGLPPGEISGVANNNDWGNLTIAVRGERLGALRDRQVPWLKSSELELWPMVADLIRGSSHRHAKILPPGKEVRDMLKVSFPDLAQPKDVLERIQALEAGLPHGLASAEDWMLAARPELTRVEVQEEIAANLKTYADRNEALASRNAPADASQAGNTLAQHQGREGGIESGVVRNEESKP